MWGIDNLCQRKHGLHRLGHYPHPIHRGVATGGNGKQHVERPEP